ncbi:MAG: TolC family protein [Rickettsiales bacterium]|nr:TolC family protein [Rickettsiales bacterium]
MGLKIKVSFLTKLFFISLLTFIFCIFFNNVLFARQHKEELNRPNIDEITAQYPNINEIKKRMSLNEILQYTYKNNPELQAKRQELNATKTLKTKAIGQGFLPSVSIQSSRGRSYSTEKYPDEKIEVDQDINRDEITLSQPIFESGKGITRIKVAKGQINVKKVELMLTEQTILLETIKSYVEILKNQEIYELSKANENSLNKNYQLLLLKKQYKRATIAEVSLAEARHALAVSDTALAKRDLATAQSNFEKITGIDSIIIYGDMEKLLKEVNSYNTTKEEIQKLAEDKNLNYILYKEKYLLSKNVLNDTKTDFLPVVRLNVGAYKNQEYSTSKEATDDISEQHASLTLTVPLMNSGSNYANYKNASYSLNQSKFDLQNAKKSLINQINTDYENFTSMKVDVQNTEIYVKSTKASLDAIKEEEKFGKKTMIDVLDRMRENFAAQIKLATSKAKMIESYYELRFILAELTEKK